MFWFSSLRPCCPDRTLSAPKRILLGSRWQPVKLSDSCQYGSSACGCGLCFGFLFSALQVQKSRTNCLFTSSCHFYICTYFDFLFFPLLFFGVFQGNIFYFTLQKQEGSARKFFILQAEMVRLVGPVGGAPSRKYLRFSLLMYMYICI